MRRRWTFAALLLALIGSWWNRDPAGALAAHPCPTAVRIIREPGVSSMVASRVRGLLSYDRAIIERDFAMATQLPLTVQLFASQQTFARALHRTQGVWPEGSQDSDGNVVHGVLLLGPPNSLLRHNLAHIYTEWVLDQLSGNWSGRQPAPAWLYDGIAEWEADRRAGVVPCHMKRPYPLALTELASPQIWWRWRGTLFSSLEYCEARDAAGRLIAHVGWPAVVRLLHGHPSWSRFARTLGV